MKSIFTWFNERVMVEFSGMEFLIVIGLDLATMTRVLEFTYVTTYEQIGSDAQSLERAAEASSRVLAGHDDNVKMPERTEWAELRGFSSDLPRHGPPVATAVRRTLGSTDAQ